MNRSISVAVSNQPFSFRDLEELERRRIVREATLQRTENERKKREENNLKDKKNENEKRIEVESRERKERESRKRTEGK